MLRRWHPCWWHRCRVRRTAPPLPSELSYAPAHSSVSPSLRFNSGKEIGAGAEEDRADGGEQRNIEGQAEMPVVDQSSTQAVDSVGQRIEPRDDAHHGTEIRQWKERSREKEDRQHHEVHDQLEALHVLNDRAERGPERRKYDRDQDHKKKSDGDGHPAMRAKASDNADNQNEAPLDDSDRGAAQSAAHHDLHPRDRGHQRLL